jgi:hypothetical protein
VIGARRRRGGALSSQPPLFAFAPAARLALRLFRRDADTAVEYFIVVVD